MFTVQPTIGTCTTQINLEITYVQQILATMDYLVMFITITSLFQIGR